MSIEIQNLTVSRTGRGVLLDICAQLGRGEVVGLLGANGAGKSTFLSAIAGEIPSDRGSVLIDTQLLTSMSALAQAQRRAVLPQKPGLTFDLVVDDVVSMGAYPFVAAKHAVVQGWVTGAMADADVGYLSGRRYPELSGGEQQRVQFARVLVQLQAIVSCQGHAYLLLDEPTSSLDPRHQAHLLEVVLKLARAHRVGVLVILHDVNLAARWCDRILLLAEQKIIAQGTPRGVLTPGNLLAVFGMRMAVLDHPLVPGRVMVLPH